MKINILGSEYELIYNVDTKEMQDAFGLCFFDRKQIKIIDLRKYESWEEETEEAIKNKIKKITRHEIIHAFLNESGLNGNALELNGSWARNEEMVDWFAIQSPKIFKLYKELDLL